MTVTFKCNLCDEIKLGHAAASGGSIPSEARIHARRGGYTFQFSLFCFRAGPTSGTADIPDSRDFHLCVSCTKELLLEALEGAFDERA